MRIVYCVAGTRHSGGMERVLANKANWLQRNGHEVVIITTDQHHESPFFPLDASIKCYDLAINYEENNGRSFFNKAIHYPYKQIRHWKRLSRLLKEIRADVVVSMFCNDASILPWINDGSKKVLEIHFSRFKYLQYNRRGLWRWADFLKTVVDKWIVGRYVKFVVLTKEDKAYWGRCKNIAVIPNAITSAFSAPSLLHQKRVLAVGRLSYQKGYDLLIDAWRKVCQVNTDWMLTIAGEGPLEAQLRCQIAKYHLEHRVELVGVHKNITSLYAEASIMVLSSRYEGLPMVLLEAQCAGLPIVAFQCKCGPKDVVSNGADGFLVAEGDICGLAEKLLLLINNSALRHQFGAMAYRNSKRYDETLIMHKWETLFRELRQK